MTRATFSTKLLVEQRHLDGFVILAGYGPIADNFVEVEAAVAELQSAAADARRPFAWVDGPLVMAMRQGDIILIDELNLAEDSVVERLNRFPFSPAVRTVSTCIPCLSLVGTGSYKSQGFCPDALSSVLI